MSPRLLTEVNRPENHYSAVDWGAPRPPPRPTPPIRTAMGKKSGHNSSKGRDATTADVGTKEATAFVLKVPTH